MRVHFIAIGGSAMHNLAIALHKQGDIVTGSDDEIFEPSLSRLKEFGILPAESGWFPGKIDKNIDAVILGMHARVDNPELLKAQEIGLKIYSYPQFLYEQSKDKLRVVIGGSHGKTTITAIVLHVLQKYGIKTGFLAGAKIPGFDVMVNTGSDADLMVFEGDEYLSSALDRRPKFHLYKPNIALLSGISYDHINVFPTYESYVSAFIEFADLIEEGGTLIYFEDDDELVKVADNLRPDIKKVPYRLPQYRIEDGVTGIISNHDIYSLKVFGKHNLLNIEGAKMVCLELGVDEEKFYRGVSDFPGASNRLELLFENRNSSVFKDFAHSPSKLKATVDAVKEQFPGRELYACIELHTFSSLNIGFLKYYSGCFDSADFPVVYYNPETLQHKKLPPINPEVVRRAFNNPKINVVTSAQELKEFLTGVEWANKNLLLMSSGNFGNISIQELIKQIGEQ